MAQLVAASYNMSFAADQNKIIGSEKHRCQANTEIVSYATFRAKSGWLNALEKVKHFVTKANESRAPFVIGMQEMNNVFFLFNKEQNIHLQSPSEQMRRWEAQKESFSPDQQELGVHYVVSELTKLYPPLQYHFSGVKAGTNYPSLLTVWSDGLGKETSTEILDLCLAHNAVHSEDPIYSLKENKEDSGRPLSIVHTDQGYTFINLHGINKNGHAVHYIDWFERFITEKIKNLQYDMDKLVIMGDFNDPHNYISNPIRGTSLSYGTAPVKSCCYNYNSSCDPELVKFSQAVCEAYRVEDNGQPLRLLPTSGDEFSAPLWTRYLNDYPDLKKYKQHFEIHVYANQCPILVYTGPTTPPQLPERGLTTEDLVIIKTMDETVGYSSARVMANGRGKVSHYKYTGDYVFMPEGMRAERSIAIFKGPIATRGAASDHEMVFIGNPSMDGGNRTRRNKTRRNKTRRNKTRRNRK